MTGDGGLRQLAEDNEIEVHGVLWVIDEIHAAGLASADGLLAVLRAFSTDASIRLPRRAHDGHSSFRRAGGRRRRMIDPICAHMLTRALDLHTGNRRLRRASLQVRDPGITFSALRTREGVRGEA